MVAFLQNFIGRIRSVSRIIEQLTQDMIKNITNCFNFVLFQEVYFF